jgi:hypothetical protein
MKQFSREEGARRLRDCPDKVWIPLNDLWKFSKAQKLGITLADIHEALKTGLLRANGNPDGKGGYTDIIIRGDGIVAWLAAIIAKRGRMQ